MSRNYTTRELLTSQHTDGEWHAVYPTGLNTLCGLPRQAKRGRPAAPNCPTCVAVAGYFGAIDDSVPAAWKWKPLSSADAFRQVEALAA